MRTADAKGTIAILSAEHLPPYYRPPLSKAYLTGNRDAAQLYIHPESFYREQAIGLRLNARVLSVDPSRQIVTTADGETGYGQLLIATGGSPKSLEVPGAALAGVFQLRSMGDADAIRQAARDAKHAIVAGGSYLGMEIACSLKQLGLDVTVIELGSMLLPYLGAPELSAYFKDYSESQGITILLNDSIAALYGEDKVQEAVTASGRRLPCGLLAAAIGISPCTDFLKGSGIALDDGYIATDEQLRASVPNVYAAGDVASFYDPVFVRRRHIEHWDNAVKQGPARRFQHARTPETLRRAIVLLQRRGQHQFRCARCDGGSGRTDCQRLAQRRLLCSILP